MHVLFSSANSDLSFSFYALLCSELMNISTGCEEIEPANPLFWRFAGCCLFHVFPFNRHAAFELDHYAFVSDQRIRAVRGAAPAPLKTKKREGTLVDIRRAR